MCVQSHKDGLKNLPEISQAFLFDTIEIDRNENNWQDSFQTIAVLANNSYKQKCFFLLSQTKVKEHFEILSNCSVFDCSNSVRGHINFLSQAYLVSPTTAYACLQVFFPFFQSVLCSSS